MKHQVRLFAALRERAGDRVLEIELADGATVADARAALAGVAGGMPYRIAVNREYADDETPIAPGDELAAIPPVSGGAEPHVRVGPEPLDPGALARAVGDPGAGAIVTFQGTTREVEQLEYEAYSEMASERIGRILTECIARHGLLGAAAEHRVGTVPLGEASVIVAVAAAHRGAAFAGAREAIDRIKAEAPIWKKEVRGDAASWVEGTLP